MKRTIFIGQAMPRHKSELHDWPSLNSWLYSIGLTLEDIKPWFFYTALVDYFPGAKNGSHLVPTHLQIEKDNPRLIRQMNDFDPEMVVPVGKLSLSYCLGQKVNHLKDHIGNVYAINPYMAFHSELTVIPLPHPSGASTWRHKDGNKKLLERALNLLKVNLF